jgi:hypothetical protein
VAAVSLVNDERIPPVIVWRPTIGEAITLFESLRSPLPERSAVVTDYNDITLISHNTGPAYIKNWIGVAAGFEALREANILDPLDVDLAEIEAHESWSRGDDV